VKAIEIKPGIYWVGAKDWTVRNFHGYETGRGTSYNAFLIMDEKITLVDTVKPSCTDEMVRRISSIIDPEKIDVIVTNHVEVDHSGALDTMVALNPNAEIIVSPNGAKGLAQYYQTDSWKMKIVKSGESFNIGKRNLTFVHTPMVHWPDSMVTYLPEDKLLLPNDAFGQHIASPTIFDEPENKAIYLDEAAKYYANIVYPYAQPVKKVMEVVRSLDFDMIAPSHGVIWRNFIPEILEKYDMWCSGENNGKAVVIYDSMWGSTETLATEIKYAFENNDVEVVYRCLKSSHISDVINDILEAKYVAFGSATLNNEVLPTTASMLTYIKGLKPTNKIGYLFGSYGWKKDVLNSVQSIFTDLKWNMPLEPVAAQYKPTEELIAQVHADIKTLCKEF